MRGKRRVHGFSGDVLFKQPVPGLSESVLSNKKQCVDVRGCVRLACVGWGVLANS